MIDLTQWIKEHPNAHFEIDNDEWYAYNDKEAYNNRHEVDDALEAGLCIDSSMVISKGDGGYGSGNIYGGDVLQALAEIVGVSIESV